MLTIRHIERLWSSKNYEPLALLLLAGRPEASPRLALQLSQSLPVAALTVLRLDELGQSIHPFCSTMLRTILAAQEADGGFGDPMTTALCLRALLCSRGHGPAIDRGVEYLANLQKPEGLWPKIPMRRMPADPFVSAYVLLHLGDHEVFQHSIRVGDAVNWFDTHRDLLDAETLRLWRTLSIRLVQRAPAESWS